MTEGLVDHGEYPRVLHSSLEGGSYLCSSSNHVFDVVCMPRTVNVGIMPLVCLIFHCIEMLLVSDLAEIS